jgi:hypothetical protein
MYGKFIQDVFGGFVAVFSHLLGSSAEATMGPVGATMGPVGATMGPVGATMGPVG